MPALPSAATSAIIVLPQPAGSIIPYVGNQSTLAGLVKLGWLLCDGSQYPLSAYPLLYAAIGTTFGGDGVSNFDVPNFLGMFLRGVDANGTVDPDYKSRTSPISGNSTVAGAVVGSRQTGQVQNHTHYWSSNFGPVGDGGNDLNLQLAMDSPVGNNLPAPQATTNHDGGGAETRPTNSYVYYLIFAGLPQTGDR